MAFDQLLHRRGTAAQWTSANPTLGAGELGYETDTGKFKMGDGVTAWNSIANYFQAGGAGAWGSITGTLSSQTDLQTALNLKATIASPTFTGTPAAPTATLGTNTTQIATTAFVAAAISALSSVYLTPAAAAAAYQPLDADLTAIAGLTDPNADRLLFWDDSAGTWAHLTLGTNLSITGTTLNASGGGGVSWGSISGTLSGQTDLQAALDAKQASDSDLTTIAGLSPANDDFLQRKAGAWANRTVAQVKTDLGLTGTNSGDQTITLTGDVTGSGSGSFAATIANNVVSLAKMATMATASFLGRNTAGTGNVEVLSAATAAGLLNSSIAPVFANITSKPTTLSGYGITDAQLLDSDLTAIAALSPTKGNIMVGNGSAWVALGVGTNTHVLTADSAEASGVKWAAGGGGGGSPGGSDTQVQFNDGGSSFGGDAGLVFNKTTNVLTTGSIVTSSGTKAACNIGTAVDNGMYVTASAFGFTNGNYAAFHFNAGIRVYAGAIIGWTNGQADATLDLSLYRDAANTFAQRNGTAAQAFNIYNTYTDASNYERFGISWSSNVIRIKPEAAGTGTTRVIHISGLPTSNPGPGILWNNAGTPAIGT